MDKKNSRVTAEPESSGCVLHKKSTMPRRIRQMPSREISRSPHYDKQSKDGNVFPAISQTKVISQVIGERFAMYHADSCDALNGIPDNSVHFQICSPPFSDLYVYSNSERDLGNNNSEELFFKHYSFIISQQLRIAMPGRLCAIHVMNLPSSKTKHGHIGLRDFRGDCIRLFEEAGWWYHSETTIWKNPVVAMQRTKALGLLHKQIKKDSCMSRMGIADFLVVFRKPGDNPERVTHSNDSFPVEVWQRYASPVWASTEETIDRDGFFVFKDANSNERNEDECGGIDQGNTLQGRSAREHDDEKHLCCLQLGVIQRAIELWSNPGDVVLSPFAGIGSEGFQAIKQGRKFVGIELKKSYFDQACLNLKAAQISQTDLLV
jgi:hypothetical protein